MSTPSSRVGCRATIVSMLHSPARTRASAAWLLGSHGTVTGVLLNGTLALLELDGRPHELPGGVRRWSVHWDDLRVSAVQPEPEDPTCGYRLGLASHKRGAAQHAVLAHQGISLCGEAVHPLPPLGWSLPFLPAASHTCQACARLAQWPEESRERVPP